MYGFVYTKQMISYLPADMITEILCYLDILSRIRYYSMIMISGEMSDIVCDNDNMIPIEKIFDYYSEYSIHRLSVGDTRLCKCLELWAQSSENMTRYFEIKEVLTQSRRNTERHFTEIWTEYGAILELKDCWSIRIGPLSKCRFIDTFLSEKKGRNEKILNYGYGDMDRWIINRG